MFHVKRPPPRVRAWCRRGGTMGRGARGRPLPSDALPSPPLARPLRRRPGAPVARPGCSRGRRRTNSRGERHGGGAATAAVRAGGARCVEVLREGCATCGERPGRRARPCRVWSVPPPSPGCAAAPRMQPSSRPRAVAGCPLPPRQTSSRSGTCRESGARAEHESECRREGARPVCQSACARGDVSGEGVCCDSPELEGPIGGA